MFYSRSMKSLLHVSDTEMYSTHNDGKSTIVEIFIRTLKTKFLNHMTVVSKNVKIKKLDRKRDKYNNTYHRTIEMKSADVKVDTSTMVLSIF